MWKFFLKKALKMFARPLMKLFMQALEEVALKSETQIDDKFIREISRYQDSILDYIMKNLKRL